MNQKNLNKKQKILFLKRKKDEEYNNLVDDINNLQNENDKLKNDIEKLKDGAPLKEKEDDNYELIDLKNDNNRLKKENDDLKKIKKFQKMKIKN